MRVRDNLQLRKVGGRYMIVDSAVENVNTADIFMFNEMAAAVWQHIEGRDFTVEEVVGWICEVYDVERDVAHNDVARQMADFASYGLLDDSCE